MTSLRERIRSFRPLDVVSSIKLKLGIAIVAAVGVSSVVSYLGFRVGLPLWPRPVISAAIALVMIQVLARGMTSPLREMADAAEAMARGDYDRRVTATSRDEVGALARAFNAMAGDLAELDRWRRDLVANVSHELRTPIAALQAVLENMVDGVEPADPDRLRLMLLQVERLGRLVTQLLDLSRLESGAIPLQRCPFDVTTLLGDAARTVELQSGTPPIVIRVADGLVADGDPERLHQVVDNLIANAVRHSPPGQAVELEASVDREGLVIEVRDCGPGIPAAEASRVFQRFYRADGAHASADGGAGLGLSIARWIVEAHNGCIEVESAPGQGSLFRVRLPLTESIV
jgi:signal transduction histidine kinase